MGNCLGRGGKHKRFTPDQALREIAEANIIFAAKLHHSLKEHLKVGTGTGTGTGNTPSSTSTSSASTSAASSSGKKKWKDQKNIVYSPLALSFLFAILKLGAYGKTHEEIVQVFCFPSTDEELINGFSQIHSFFNLEEFGQGFVFAAANRIFIQAGFEFKKEFSRAIKNFGSAVIRMNFGSNTAAAEKINSWIQQETKSKIRNLVPSVDLREDTSLCLVNALYFKGLWKFGFLPELTQKESFAIGPKVGDTVQVHMMHNFASFHYLSIEELNAQVIALPFADHRLSMLIYLPQTRMGLSKVEKGLNLNLPDLLKKLKETSARKIHLSLPKFKIDSSLQLVEPLKKMGIELVFIDGGADLNGISETTERLSVSRVIHKAVVEICEDGKEIAKGAKKATEENLPHIEVNHPFFFQILDVSTSFIIFAGNCKNPSSK